MREKNEAINIGIPIVVRYRDGHMIKCFTKDFYPTKDRFHITSESGITHIIKLNELKAIFFVKDFQGDRYHIDSRKFNPKSEILGRKIGIKFKDGEMIIGSSFNYNEKNKGFFLTPADSESNNKKIFIISDSVEKIIFLS